MPDKKEIILHSDLEELPKLEEFLDFMCTSCNVHEDIYPDIMLAVTEATTNAIIHGNEFDPSKSVQLTCISNDDEITFQVKDEGSGFDPHNLPNPVEEDNLLKSGGRGVYLIRHYAKSVAFNEKGNQITMTFDINPE
ncbi:ATP-binding protein [bacterium]|nr:MAG: ATP-binding protein [bacterium]